MCLSKTKRKLALAEEATVDRNRIALYFIDSYHNQSKASPNIVFQYCDALSFSTKLSNPIQFLTTW